MPRIRREHTTCYTVITNELIQDIRLSWKARGIMIYLLSMPEDWEFNLVDLANRAPDGKAALRSGVAELESAGYVRIEKERSPTGTFDGWTWHVFEQPEPRSENRTSDKLKSDNRTLQSKQEQKKQGAQNAPVADAPIVSAPPVAAPGLVELSYMSGDLEVQCACGEYLVLENLDKHRAECPHCHAYLLIRNEHDTIKYKPRQKERHTIKVLGDLLEGCPAQFADVPYSGRDKDRLLVMWAEQRAHLLLWLEKARGWWVEGSCRKDQLAERALKNAASRVSSDRKASVPEPTPMPAGWTKAELEAIIEQKKKGV